MLETAVPKRPHALLVGQLPAITGWHDPEADLELRRVSADRAPEAIRQAAADVVVRADVLVSELSHGEQRERQGVCQQQAGGEDQQHARAERARQKA